jgi:putative PIN family toxin of toxin-antitoxin system
MYKVVLDTNIYISAILFGGKPEMIRTLSREKKIEVLISEEIISEIVGVLEQKFGWERSDLDQIVEEIRELNTLIVTSRYIPLIKNDDTDNRIIECAVEGNAQYIVSGDKRHLLPLKEYKGIKILTPDEFLKLIYESDNFESSSLEY